jgi:hypothetical protein
MKHHSVYECGSGCVTPHIVDLSGHLYAPGTRCLCDLMASSACLETVKIEPRFLGHLDFSAGQ